ncbi:MAG: Flp pilus assembly protein CpaB [Alphaproteobacteria bacterium]|nr:Flp pilus assembly protein CpaB [Alphaproteobacteria bacterium]
MSAMRLLILLIAVCAAGGTAFLVHQMTKRPAQTAVAPAPADEVHILAAARDIEIGVRLAPGDLRWQPWPKSAVNGQFITREGTPGALDEATGAVVRVPMIEGEPVVEAKLVRSSDGGFMAARLQPGMRALSIEISAETGAGGFILPNDRVDVILTRELADEGGRRGKAFQTETILQSVRVLAIDQNYEQVEGKQVVVGKTATLELTPVQAEATALASAAGELQLSLRSVADPNSPVETDDTSAQGGGVTLVRYGVQKQVSVGTDR